MNRLQQIVENRYAGSWCRGIIVSGLLGIASQSVALEITGFQPASGMVGETVHVSGSGLDAVTSLSMGGESMVLEQISSTELRFVVSDGVASGLLAFATDEGTTYAQDVFIVDDGTLDMDGDGLPDSWERQFLGGVVAVSNADGDGDGFSNEQEWVAGTDPSRINSALQVTEVVWKDDGEIEVAWASVAGKSYAIQYRAELDSGDWTTLGTKDAAAGAVRMVLRDFQQDPEAKLGFFRIFTPPPGTEVPRNFKVQAFANPPEGGNFQGMGAFASGTAIELLVQPTAGYLFQGWGMGLAGTDNPAQFNLAADIFIVGHFQEIPQTASEYRIATQAVPVLGGEVLGAGKYEAGMQAALEAVPFNGYKFHGWEGDLSGSQNPLQVTVNQTLVVTARFVQESYSLRSVSSPVHGGSVTGSGTFVFGAQATLEAVPAAEYSFTGWSGAASGTDNPLTLEVRSDALVNASFVLKAQGHLMQASSHDADKGSVTGAGAYAVGATATLAAVPVDGQAFVQWTGSAKGSANPISITMDGDRSVKALFAPETFPVSIESEGPGAVAGGGVYLAGTEVTLSASPLGQSQLVGWSGDIESKDTTIQLTVDKPFTLKATFESSGGEESMVLIPGGKFTMGDARKTKGPLGPAHEVEVSPFYLGKNEVTKKEWDVVHEWALKNGYDFTYDGSQVGSVPVSPGDDYPIVNATWYDMVKWCNARSEMEGFKPAYFTSESKTEVYRIDILELLHTFVDWQADGYRLPTEAQWESAARGGLDGKRYPNGDSLDDALANFNNNVGTLSVVGSYPANGYGLYDMAGNAFEACWDWYDKDWYANAASTEQDTHGPKSGVDGFQGTLRLVRGGSYRKSIKFSEVSYRGNFNKTWKNYAISFRVAIPKLVVGSSHGLAVQVSPQHSGTVIGNGSYAAGTSISINASPAPGFVFAGWTGDLQDKAAEASIRMDGPKILTANFVPSPALLDDDADGLTNAEEIGYGRYEVIQGQFTWDAAGKDARDHGGRLATLVSEAESSAILEVLGGAWPTETLWLGGLSLAGQGWTWSTGEPWTYTNWEGNPPDISSKDRYLQLGTAGTWGFIVPRAEDLAGYLLEKGFYTDPAEADTDGDGLTDWQEIGIFLTLPNLADTDGDGITDGTEVLELGSRPLVKDTDGDGFSDKAEQDAGSIATNPDSTPMATVSGPVTYAGTMQGKVYLTVSGKTQVLDAPGDFSQVGLSTGQFHKVTAYMDVDADGVQDSWEPRGEYAENPFPISKDLGGVSVLLQDPDNDGDGLTDIYEMGRGRYQVVKASLSWEGARDDAISRGGHLATITSLAEWEAVRKYAGNTFPSAGAKYDLWIGGMQNKGAPDNPWQWITGETWSYQRWMPDEPSGTSGQHDGFLYVDSGGADNNFLWKRGTPFNASNRYLLEFGDFTDPAKADTDGDGLEDGEESNNYKTEPKVVDTDRDGLSDGDEVKQHNTSPTKIDTDGDSFSDGGEITAGSDPLDIKSYPAGNISGTVAYDGIPRGTIYITTGSRGTSILQPGNFVLSGMTTGQSYNLWSFRDVNGNTRQDSWEPAGTFAGNPIKFSESIEDLALTLSDPDTDGDGLADSWEMGYLRYEVIEGENLTWQTARDDAVSRGGHLATILSEEEWMAIYEAAGPSFPPAKFQYNLWAGGYRDKGSPDNPWKWITGEIWDKTRWREGEPSPDSGQHAAYLFVASDPEEKFFWWRGSPFNNTKRYLLEKGYFTDPTKADTDGDGLTDGDEVATHKTIPTLVDTDGDGLGDGVEFTQYKTEPNKSDSDADGFNDGDEVSAGTDPLDNTSYPAANISGMVVYDGIPRGKIYLTTGSRGTAVLAPGNFVLTGVATGISYDLSAFRDVNGNARQDSWEPAGTYANNPINLSVNLDGITVTLTDPDSDGDGLADSWEMGYLRYEVIEGEVFTWGTARDDAVSRGGHLATILSEEEWTAIYEAAGPSFPPAKFEYNLWAGGYRDKGSPDNPWKWITGETWDNTRWREGEPSPDSGQHAAYLFIASDPEEKFLWWRGSPFNNTKRYLLEYGYPTDPAKADTDGDGFNDGAEFNAGTNSLDSSIHP